MSQTLKINAVPGITAAKLFTVDTDTVAYTASSVTAGTNDASFYTIVFATANDGVYRLALYIGTFVAATETVTVGDGVFDISVIGPSDPGKRTGYLVCYDQNGDVESGVAVECWCVYAPNTGLALDSQIRTATSDVDGVVQFANMIVGAKYRVKRGDNSQVYNVEVATGTGAFAINSIVGTE